jgi:transglutaminase-like putative cysteine protease
MNPRLTLTAAAAVILASVSVYPLIQNGAWFWAGAGAVIVTAAAGTLTRLPAVHAAVGATAVALIAACPLLASPGWPGRALGAVIVATAVASRPRIRIRQVLGSLVTYAGGLLIYLNVTFAARLSVLGVVPTAASAHHLWSLAGQGLADRGASPPVTGNPGITLMTAAGIGLMAAAADVIAVRLRRPAIAGLPLLALYSVPITTDARQGWVGATVVFCLTVIGYLALLAAGGRDRLCIWGRLVTVWHNSTSEQTGSAKAPDTRALAASGRRIGLAAACVALAFPLLIPGLRVHDLFQTGHPGPGPGSSQIILPSPLVQMNGQLLDSTPQTVLTYRTNAPKPQQQYLQAYVLNYDPGSGTWTGVPLRASVHVGSGPLRAAPGVTRGTPQTRSRTEIKFVTGVTGYDSGPAVLPLPYAPATVQVRGSWQEDNTTLMVYSAAQSLSGLSYTVTSTQPDPGGRELDQAASSYPPGISGSYTYFPPGPGQELAKLAATITRGDRTPIAKAVALQNYFTSPSEGFTYNINVKLPDGIAGLDDFLFHTRQGYCQQFAFAMAALARLAGIPSRIAVGYTAGTKEADGRWKVTTADAHAWPELYIRDVGWLRFEPTPGGGAGTAIPPDYPVSPGTSITSGSATGRRTGVRPGTRTGNPNLAHLRRPGMPTAAGASRDAPGHSSMPAILSAVAVVAGLALITPMTARSLVRRRRLRLLRRSDRREPGRPHLDATGLDDQSREAEYLEARRLDAALAHAAWRELRDNLADYRHASRPSESPRALAGRIETTLHLDPVTRRALQRIVSAEERACYAAVPLGPGTLRADTAAVRRALSQEAEWTVRWRAWLLPESMLTLIRLPFQRGRAGVCSKV